MHALSTSTRQDADLRLLPAPARRPADADPAPGPLIPAPGPRRAAADPGASHAAGSR